MRPFAQLQPVGGTGGYLIRVVICDADRPWLDADGEPSGLGFHLVDHNAVLGVYLTRRRAVAACTANGLPIGAPVEPPQANGVRRRGISDQVIAEMLRDPARAPFARAYKAASAARRHSEQVSKRLQGGAA